MPIYHFEVNDLTHDSDRTVVELEDLAEAKCEAVKFTGNLICEAAGTFWDKQECTLTVTDDAGLTLFRLQVVGTEGPVAQKLSRIGYGEGTFDQKKKADEANTGVDGS